MAEGRVDSGQPQDGKQQGSTRREAILNTLKVGGAALATRLVSAGVGAGGVVAVEVVRGKLQEEANRPKEQNLSSAGFYPVELSPSSQQRVATKDLAISPTWGRVSDFEMMSVFPEFRNARRIAAQPTETAGPELDQQRDHDLREFGTASAGLNEISLPPDTPFYSPSEENGLDVEVQIPIGKRVLYKNTGEFPVGLRLAPTKENRECNILTIRLGQELLDEFKRRNPSGSQSSLPESLGGTGFGAIIAVVD